MPLLATMDVPFRFSFERADGSYALSLSSLMYPTSCARHEAFVRPDPSRPSATSTPPCIDASSPGRSFDKYPLPDMREVSPGVLASGQLTDNHPLVSTYLDALVRIMPRVPAPPAASSASSSPVSTHGQLAPAASAAVPPHTTAAAAGPGEITHWRAHHAGIASTRTLPAVISQQFQLFPGHASRLYAGEIPKLSEIQKQSILALAALKVLNHPTHPAHFALWGKNILQRTAHVVDAVLRTYFASSLPSILPPPFRLRGNVLIYASDRA